MGVLGVGILQSLGHIVQPGGAFHHLRIGSGGGGQPARQQHGRIGVLEAVVEDGLVGAVHLMADAPEPDRIGVREAPQRLFTGDPPRRGGHGRASS